MTIGRRQQVLGVAFSAYFAAFAVLLQAAHTCRACVHVDVRDGPSCDDCTHARCPSTIGQTDQRHRDAADPRACRVCQFVRDGGGAALGARPSGVPDVASVVRVHVGNASARGRLRRTPGNPRAPPLP
jgi:hypothetical protein